MAFVPFELAESVGDRFLKLLDRLNIKPPIDSSFNDELLSIAQLVEIYKKPSLAQGTNADATLRAAAGVHDFAAKVLSVEALPEFPQFQPHLELIATSKISTASMSQNGPGAYNDDTARKMAELYLGCLAAHVGAGVELDSPTNAKGDNPDVIVTLRPNLQNASDERWAIAVKTISSRSGQTIFERIEEGARQINHPACPADHGIVVINLKDALDHARFWESPFADEAEAMKSLAEEMAYFAEEADANRTAAEWDGVLTGRVARPIIFLCQTVVRLPSAFGGEIPTPLKMMQMFNAQGTENDTASSLAWHLNHLMQIILVGVQRGPNAEPH